jgi:hypothetical protein
VYTVAASLHSIQGEQQHANQTYEADTADIEDYVASVPDEVLECREGVHRFPSIRQGIEFIGKDQNGFYIREVRCLSCERAIRREEWISRGTGQHRRWEMLDRTLRYITVNGVSYLAKPHTGRMPKRKIRNTIVTQQLSGFKSIRELEKKIIKAQPKTLTEVDD